MEPEMVTIPPEIWVEGGCTDGRNHYTRGGWVSDEFRQSGIDFGDDPPDRYQRFTRLSPGEVVVDGKNWDSARSLLSCAVSILDACGQSRCRHGKAANLSERIEAYLTGAEAGE